MNCAICGRRLFKAAIQIGRMAVGPKCARRAGLIQTKPKKQERADVVRDELTADLFAEVQS
jgi:ribosome-binding protein aMBF1 (putative translation factor)